MNWKSLLFCLPFAGCLFLGSCSQYQDVLKSDDYPAKLAKAKEYYNKGNYYKALPLFEDLVDFYKGTSEMQDVYYYYAFTYYQEGEFLLAAYHFKTFATSYPDDPKAEECLFMNAKCYFLLSPNPELDQDYTKQAIDALQLFANAYPNSTRMQDANSMMDLMRLKLEDKAFGGAALYYKMGKYHASAVALQNVLNDYPDSPNAEQMSFLILKSKYLYALNSIPSKQAERYQATLTAYQNFSSQYPASDDLKEAKDIYDNSLKNLDKAKTYEQE